MTNNTNIPALVLGIISIVFGAIAIVFSILPLFGAFGSIPSSLIGIILAVIGLLFSSTKNWSGFGPPLVGLLVCAVGIFTTYKINKNVVKKIEDINYQEEYYKTIEDIKVIEVALLSYKISTNGYPTTDQGLQALLIKPDDVSGWSGPYFDDEIIDPWGNEYGYRFPSQKGQKGPDIYSTGADGIKNTKDDIGNWQKE